jgi:hypothetical protein
MYFYIIIKKKEIMTYSTITKETFNTICVAYPDKNGVETENSLNNYEAKSQGCVELIFVESQKEAIELLKSF